MQVLSRVHDYGEALRIAELMREKGIATYTRTAGNPRSPDQWIIFVCLSSQFDEAARVLEDPSYEPVIRIDVATFEAELPGSNLGMLGKWGLAILLVVLAVFAAIVMSVTTKP